MRQFGENTLPFIEFAKPGKTYKEISQKLKWADKKIWWTFQKHIMEVKGGLLKWSSQGRKRLWWRQWAYTLGCTCQMDRSWQHHGLSRFRRCNSSGDLQSHPGKDSNKKRLCMTSKKLPLTQPLYTVFTEPEICLGARIIPNIAAIVVRMTIFNYDVLVAGSLTKPLYCWIT